MNGQRRIIATVTQRIKELVPVIDGRTGQTRMVEQTRTERIHFYSLSEWTQHKQQEGLTKHPPKGLRQLGKDARQRWEAREAKRKRELARAA